MRWPVDLSLTEEHEESHSGHTNTKELAVIASNIKVTTKLPDQFIF